ncbi:MAG: E3 binding domain-containing protein, partial [Lewinella sp.]|nr:E3 binding domain-containing protein [Lewinella sp.]
MSIVEMKVPVIGESITEVTLSQWLKADGEYVNLDEPICEFESDKATLEFPAEAAGKLIHVAAEDQDLEIGALVAKIDTSVTAGSGGGEPAPAPAKEKAEAKESAPAETKETTAPPAAEKETYASGHPSPAAAKILKENDVPADAVKGSGRDGRIT